MLLLCKIFCRKDNEKCSFIFRWTVHSLSSSPQSYLSVLHYCVVTHQQNLQSLLYNCTWNNTVLSAKYLNMYFLYIHTNTHTHLHRQTTQMERYTCIYTHCTLYNTCVYIYMYLHFKCLLKNLYFLFFYFGLRHLSSCLFYDLLLKRFPIGWTYCWL